ncbi:MAG: ribonuclease Z [Planctomycetota bacterium]|nr:ribonuclease Z [Planctomycetota bacterium]
MERGAGILDAAAGTYMRALKAGLEARRLRFVAITHFHLDHVADLPALFWARKQLPELDVALPIVAPAGLAAELPPLMAAHEFAAYPFECDGLLIDAFPAVHKPESVCLRVTADGKTLAYSGDTEDCDGLRAACRDADLALLECSSNEPLPGHLTPAGCEAVRTASGARRVLLTHLGPDVVTELPRAEDGLVVRL